MPRPSSGSRPYFGRVRTGCLTCRAAKVKCTEDRPECARCQRVQRQCVYPQKSRTYVASSTSSQLSQRETTGSPGDASPEPTNVAQRLIASKAASQNLQCGHHTSDRPCQSAAFFDTETLDRELISRLSRSLQDFGASIDLGDHPESCPSFISRDIQLTTTMDLLAVQENLAKPGLDYFREAVSCPQITPFDPGNWYRAKENMLRIAENNTTIETAILAVSGLHKCLEYRLTPTQPLLLYIRARNAVDRIGYNSESFELVLVGAFLLCQFELIYSSADVVPYLKHVSHDFIQGLQAFSKSGIESALCCRLVAWLTILYWTTLRGGGTGLVSDTVYAALPPIPSILAPFESAHAGLAEHVYDTLSAPIFRFYLELQIISGSIAQLTHYHRSRNATEDQQLVISHIEQAKSKLRQLWMERSALQRRSAAELRLQLGADVSRRIIALVGICTANYLAEFVELDRVLGDPVSKWTDSRTALQDMRQIIDGDWEACMKQEGGPSALNPGYLRPLFLHAIESMDQEQTQWAVDRMNKIKCSIHRSDFFASFAQELAEMQIRKERRVTSRYFCIWSFGVPPPYL